MKIMSLLLELAIKIIKPYLFKLAFRNVFRQKRRTTLTVIILMFSVGIFVFFQSYLEGAMGSMIDDTIKAAGHISIQHPEYQLKERMLSLNSVVSDYESLKEEISKTPGLKAVTGRIKFGGLVDINENNEPGLGMGIETEIEREIIQLENSIIAGGYFTGGPKETVIGVEFARKLNIEIGDTITIISSTAYASLTAENLVVVGIADLLSGALNRMFFMPLKTAQVMLDMENQVSEIVVFLNEPEEILEVKSNITAIPSIAGTYAAIAWNEKGFLKDMLPMMDLTKAILIGLFGMIAAFSIVNTMLMAVLERTNEIGVMTAFGMKRLSVLQIFLFEAVVIGIIGGVLGLAVGGYFGYYLETTGLNIGKVVENFPIPMRQTIYGDLRLSHMVSAFIIGICLSLAGAFFPALKAARMEPTDALRKS